jgi:hypothetical protein
VIARRHDDAFWNRLKQQVTGDPGTCTRLGIVIHLISRVMGRFAPEALTCWTVDCLPAAARLWVDLYGRRTVLASFPGNKLYLLLQKELEAAGVPAKRSLRQALLPVVCRRQLPMLLLAKPSWRASSVIRGNFTTSFSGFAFTFLRGFVIFASGFFGGSTGMGFSTCVTKTDQRPALQRSGTLMIPRLWSSAR